MNDDRKKAVSNGTSNKTRNSRSDRAPDDVDRIDKNASVLRTSRNEEQPPRPNHRSGFEKWTGFANVGMFVVTIGLFWVGWQTNVTTKRAVEDAREHARIELRAYVSTVKGEVVGLAGSGPMYVRVIARNTGNTPVHETMIESDMWWEDEVTAMAAPIADGVKTTLAPGEDVYREHEIDVTYREKLTDREAVLHVAGSVLYRDEFGEEHEFPFHYVQGGKYDPNSPLMGVVSIETEKRSH
jgi:hypothetical protein